MTKIFSFLVTIITIIALGISAYGLNHEKNVISDSRIYWCNGGGCNTKLCTADCNINIDWLDCENETYTCKFCMDLHVQGELEECGHQEITFCWQDGKKYWGDWLK